MRGRGGGLARVAGGLAAALLLCAVALTARPATADTGTPATVPTLLAPSESTPPEDTTAWWWKKRYLALYKTISYTAVVLTTDQLWYMAVATQAATSSGFFGVVNLVTSPMLTYGFEYAWQHCCEAPPGPDGVRPVDVNKALIYRVVSTARILVMALAFASWVIARLGGWTGYYGKPGPAVIRHGLDRFYSIKLGAQVARDV